MATFNELYIFGVGVRVAGPMRSYRNQREQLPMVDGFRVYRLGQNGWTWKIRGRLVAATPAELTAQLEIAQDLADGQLYTFVDNAGGSFDDCMLSDYRPAGPMQWSHLGYTVEIDATVEWLSPD